ncbi:MAG: FHA domain-containing protein [Planctomycetaceae bacterium]
MTSDRHSPPAFQPKPAAARLWIDGVGTWVIWMDERYTIGGPTPPGRLQAAADLPLLADLSRVHAAIERAGEQYRLTLLGDGGVVGRPESGEQWLRSGDELRLGRDVRLKFEQPSPLSLSARLAVTSGHRPPQRIDGVVLLEQACLLGPGSDQHIVCPRAKVNFVLYRKGTALWCRCPEQWKLDGSAVSGAAELFNGSFVSHDSLSFRLEWS